MTRLLLIIGLVLLILWLIGFVSAYTLGGYIHILLIIAVIMLVIWIVKAAARRR
jgi:hypothetical protein